MNRTITSTLAILLVSQLGSAHAQSTVDDKAEAAQAPSASTDQIIAASEQQQSKSDEAQKKHEPIESAFGIPLGKVFEPAMVTKVVSDQPKNYRSADGSEHTGMHYSVVPTQPDKRFQDYTIMTTDKGVIYEVRADFQMEKKSEKLRADCKTEVKALAHELETRHGEPRGKGWQAEWFAFRQQSDESDRSIRVLGNHCRTGKYSVIYSDRAVTGEKNQQQTQQQPKADKAETDS